MKKLLRFIIEKLRPIIREIAGWDELKEETATIRYVLDNYIDIREFPKATGVLRQCQLGDAELLRIVCEILTKNNIQYWLGYGTLLGAVRHKGFIPWDDDLDICMTRDNYNKAWEVLPEELKKYDININEPNPQRIAISIWKAGLILDIFPVDNVDVRTVKDLNDLKSRLIKYRSYYKKHKNDTPESLKAAKEKIIGPESSDNPIWYHNVEFGTSGLAYDNSMIFPLKVVEFEGYEFYAPNDCHKYLTTMYGNYMSFPRNGVLHHHGCGGQNITENAIKKGIDMEKFIEELKQYKVD